VSNDKEHELPTAEAAEQPAAQPTKEEVPEPETGSGAEPQRDGETEAEADTAVVEDPLARLEQITAERDRLAAENDELRNQLLRRQADFENYRRRVERERAEFLEFAGMEAVRAMLPILDDFERALTAGPGEEGIESEYVRGIEMIYQRFLEALKKLGLTPIESVGQPFDPNVHHAIETVPTEDAEDHTVIEELQKGYNFKGKLLREAMVKVAVKPS